MIKKILKVAWIAAILIVGAVVWYVFMASGFFDTSGLTGR